MTTYLPKLSVHSQAINSEVVKRKYELVRIKTTKAYTAVLTNSKLT